MHEHFRFEGEGEVRREKQVTGMWMKKRFSLFQNNHRNALTIQDKYIMQKQFGIQPTKLKTVLYCAFLKGFAIWVVNSKFWCGCCFWWGGAKSWPLGFLCHTLCTEASRQNHRLDRH